MTVKPARLLFALIAVVAMPAFAQNLAVVNGKPIPTSRLDTLVKQVVASGQEPDSITLRDKVKKSLIDREVMIQEATKLGFDKNADVKLQLEGMRQNILINAMVRDFLTKNPVKDAEITAAYAQYKANAPDKEFKVRHILVETEADAKAVIAKLKSGSRFEDLAKTSKDAASASTGGDLDWRTAVDFPKSFGDAMVALQKGAVTDTPVKTEAGFHIVKVDDTRPAKVAVLEEIKPQITESLQRQKLAAFQDALIKKAAIK